METESRSLLECQETGGTGLGTGKEQSRSQVIHGSGRGRWRAGQGRPSVDVRGLEQDAG
jgi:hypothetical protein